MRDMSNQEAVEMMRRAAGEIRHQRGIIETLSPKAEAYDTIRKILNLIPGQGGYTTEDLAYTLDRRAKELEEIVNADKHASDCTAQDPLAVAKAV